MRCQCITLYITVFIPSIWLRYVSYIENLCDKHCNAAEVSLYDQFCASYRDNLQSPLHPLADNLDSETYRVMEKDPVKYSQYERALYRAMQDLAPRSGSRDRYSSIPSPGGDGGDRGQGREVLHVLVVGAGRGPLVQAALNAAVLVNVKIRVWAVEKNFNAVVTLRNRFRHLRPRSAADSAGNTVAVLWCDMRDLRSSHPEIRASIVVSELLGSWGDNEASPECLYALEAMREGSGGGSGLLEKECVMIPQSYCSFMAPVSCTRLWIQARDMFRHHPMHELMKGLDMPYVVNMESACLLADAQPLFQVLCWCLENDLFNVERYLLS